MRSLRGATLLLTGGSGFLGRAIAETFCALDERCGLGAKLLLLTRDAERFRHEMPHVANDKAVTIVSGDLASLTKFDERCDYVVHGATAPANSLANDPAALVATIAGTAQLLDYAARVGAKRIAYLSSGALYGRGRGTDADLAEDFAGAPDVRESRAAYGESKRVGELLCAQQAARTGLEYVSLRAFSFVGPHIPLDAKFAAGSFLRDALEQRAVEIRGDGTVTRSYMHTIDFAAWLWVILLRGQSGRAYHVGSETPVTTRELANEIASYASVPVIVRETPDPSKPIDRYVPSTARARQELGLTQTIDWRSAMRRTYDWYQQRRAANEKETSVDSRR
ncbi:MAG TPA: NAD(P)-dependent oxidoreductase [Thermoanaerobaculia bacterium]